MIFQLYFWLLLLCCFLCIYRIATGPTPPDRAVAINAIGLVVVGISALYTLVSGNDFYINVSLSWALLSFIGSIALAKFFEGKRFDE
ncbi:MAG: monovalent cation/H+ antiporter complex subunit F [Elusimicrobiota bacterium]